MKLHIVPLKTNRGLKSFHKQFCVTTYGNYDMTRSNHVLLVTYCLWLVTSVIKKMASTWKIHLTMVYLIVLFILANTQSKQITTVSDISYILR